MNDIHQRLPPGVATVYLRCDVNFPWKIYQLMHGIEFFIVCEISLKNNVTEQKPYSGVATPNGRNTWVSFIDKGKFFIH